MMPCEPAVPGGAAEPLSEMLAAVSRIDGVDVELALSRISGKQSVLEDCIKQTVDSMGETLRKMSGCLSTEDLRRFSIEAHGLKVALAGIGATKHSGLAAQLEAASKLGSADECKREFIVFAGLTRELAEKLESALPDEDVAAKSKGDMGFLFQIIKETGDCLGLFETDDALACMKKLETLTFGDETDALLGRIRSKIRTYKYDEAILLIDSILKQGGHIKLS